jgi:hypothetical protein
MIIISGCFLIYLGMYVGISPSLLSVTSVKNRSEYVGNAGQIGGIMRKMNEHLCVHLGFSVQWNAGQLSNMCLLLSALQEPICNSCAACFLEGIWKLGQRESANTYYNFVYANQWHKTGFARQAAAWEKANSENT